MNSKNNNFCIIRLVAAFMVIAGHTYSLTNSSIPIIMFATVQRLGLIIFFIIGGYLITESWKRDPHFLRYMIKRIFRIFPALVACIFFTAFVIGPVISSLPLKEYFSHPATWNYLKNIFLYVVYALPGVFENNPYQYSVNGSLWTLPIEFFMYLVIPLFYEAGRRMNGKIHLLFTGIICVIHIYLEMFYPEWRFVIYGTDIAQAMTIIPYYLLGSLVSTLELKNIWNLQISFALLFLFQGLNLSSPIWTNALCYLVIPYVIFSFAFCNNPISALPIFKKLEISYGLYLYGFFIQQIIIEIFCKLQIPLGGGIPVLLISLVATSICAVLSSKYIEKPALNIQKRILSKIEKKD